MAVHGKKIIFVCLGNICRSPMAELVFKDMVKRQGLKLEIDSCGTSDEEEGNGIYPPAKAELNRHGIFGEHTARQITKSDVVNADYILGMDGSNMRVLHRLAGEKYADKLSRLCDFTDNPRDVADPWYTRNFKKAYEDIVDGCSAFLNYLLAQE